MKKIYNRKENQEKGKLILLWIAGIFFFFLIFISGNVFLENRNLQKKLKEAEEENYMLQEQSIFLKGQSIPIIKQNMILKEKEKKYQESVRLLESMEQGIMEHIRRSSSASDVKLLRKELVGENIQENMKWFYLCSSRSASGFYQAEFYLADYLTGKIYNCNQNVPNVRIALSAAEVKEADYQIWIEDLDGNGWEDILVVWISEKEYLSQGIYLWLQRDGEFLPVNREYCGYHTERGESDFSKQIQELEETLLEKQDFEGQQINELVKWIKQELF